MRVGDAQEDSLCSVVMQSMTIACCNDGTCPVVFKLERIDIPVTPEEEVWLPKQNFTVSADRAITGENTL